MKANKHFLAVALCACGVSVMTTSSAELYERNGGTMIYDSDQDITWLADANYAATLYETSCGEKGVEDGRMGNPSAQEMVKNMRFGGYTDWRLPVTEEVDETCQVQSVTGSSSYDCTGGEMGSLFYNALGGKAKHRLTQTHNSNYSKFRNVQSGTYWTGTDFSPVPQIGMNFQTSDGAQNANSKSVKLLVWPVRDGDVDASSHGDNHNPSSWGSDEAWMKWKKQQRYHNQCDKGSVSKH